jgi:hypothetical protein
VSSERINNVRETQAPSNMAWYGVWMITDATQRVDFDFAQKGNSHSTMIQTAYRRMGYIQLARMTGRDDAWPARPARWVMNN